jgi:hypothetical protein
MEQPESWPFESWLDLDRVESHPTTAQMGAVYRYIHHEMMERFFRFVWPRSPYNKKIVCGFTAELAFGAQASITKPPTKFAVCVHGLTWPQCFSTLERLFASAQTFPDYGVESLERKPRRYALALFRPSGPTFSFEGEDTGPPPLTDEIRRRCLYRTLIYIVTFVILHEIAHVICGHLAHLEISGRRADGDRREELLAVEHAADAWALTNGLSLVSLQTDQAPADAFHIFGFAVAVFCLLLEQIYPEADAGDLQTHPRAAHRLFFCKAVSQGFLSPNSETGPKVRQDVLAGMEHAEVAWRAMAWGLNAALPESIDFMQRPLELYEQLKVQDPSILFT